MRTAAAVLAAGAGSRFAGGHHKLLAPFRDRPLVTWAVQAALDAGLEETFVVCGAVDLSGVLPAGVTVLANDRWAEGQATSLATAVAASAERGYDAVVVGLGDQPLVIADAWIRVGRAPAAPIVVATYAGVRRHPVRLAEDVWPFLPTVGDRGARTLMTERPDLVREVACPGDPADVDTAEDLTRWS